MNEGWMKGVRRSRRRRRRRRIHRSRRSRSIGAGGTLKYGASSSWHASTLTGGTGRAGGRTLTGGSGRVGRADPNGWVGSSGRDMKVTP